MTTELEDLRVCRERLQAAEQQAHRAQRRLHLLATMVIIVTTGAVFFNSLPRAHADITPKDPLTVLLARVSALETKTAHITSTATDLTISGANVHIVDGSGTTGSSSSLGNLILGYNASRGLGSDLRTGSHNLILGDRQNYSGFGGLVAGYSNSIGKPYATVTGGYNNAANGTCSTIAGGNANLTSGDGAAVSGGYGNNAAANALLPFDTLAAVVAGLQATTAPPSGSLATLTSALAQETSARQSADAGLQTQMSALSSSVTQESSNSAAAIAGLQTQITAMSGSLSTLQAKTQYITVDTANKAMFITGANLFLQSGSGATDDGGNLTGLGNLIIGYNKAGNGLGFGDIRTGSHNLVLGDQNNYSSYGGMVAGINNMISNIYATVTGGGVNMASGQYSSVTGGVGNTASATGASIGGGAGNTASATGSSVSGGSSITVSAVYGWAGGSYHTP